MSDAILGTGTLLAKGDGASPEVFTDIAELTTIKIPQLSRNEIDVSTHNAAVEEKILGLLRTGQATFGINFLPGDATHDATTGLWADVVANNEHNWRITTTDSPSTTFTFLGRVQLLDVQEITTDSPIQANCAITVNGAITVA